MRDTGMLIPSADSADVIRARFRAWSKEWRESRYPPAMRALGHISWPLVEDGAARYRYSIHLGWPFRVYDAELSIELIENDTRVALRAVPRLSPSLRTVAALSLTAGLVVVVGPTISGGWDARALGPALGAALAIAVALLAERPFAAARLRRKLPGIEAFLREVVVLDPPAPTP